MTIYTSVRCRCIKDVIGVSPNLRVLGLTTEIFLPPAMSSVLVARVSMYITVNSIATLGLAENGQVFLCDVTRSLCSEPA